MIFSNPTRTVVIKNKAGIHCRPSSCIMMKASEFPGCVFKVKTTKGISDLSSILSLISLGLQYGDEAVISASGTNAEKACEEIAKTFETEFDFPPR